MGENDNNDYDDIADFRFSYTLSAAVVCKRHCSSFVGRTIKVKRTIFTRSEKTLKPRIARKHKIQHA